MTIETTHEGCHACQRMAREAVRTEREHGTGHWTSQTIEDGIAHTALYFAPEDTP